MCQPTTNKINLDQLVIIARGLPQSIFPQALTISISTSSNMIDMQEWLTLNSALANKYSLFFLQIMACNASTWIYLKQYFAVHLSPKYFATHRFISKIFFASLKRSYQGVKVDKEKLSNFKNLDISDISGAPRIFQC